MTTKLAEMAASGDGLTVIKKAFDAIPTAQQEALTDEQAASGSSSARIGRSLVDVVAELIGMLGIADEAIADATELLVSTGCAGLTAAEATAKLDDWSASDVLAIRDSSWEATDWAAIRKAESSFFAKAGQQLGHLIPGLSGGNAPVETAAA